MDGHSERGAAADGERTEGGPVVLSLLGATGSIGRSTLDIVAGDPGRYALEAVTASTRVDELAAIALRFKAKLAVIADPARYADLRERLSGSRIEVAAGPEAVAAAAARPVDMLVSAIVGAAGLPPSLAAIGAARTIALANKETLVSGGGLFMAAAKAAGTTILPVDSEHNAIFQSLEAANAREVAEIILTASGGPFWRLSLEEMASVTRDMALRHPRWSMGPKVTIDSATMMNKGLEIIEASHLFPVAPDRISVLVHPQSVVHGLVRYTDGALIAEIGTPDMRTPIGHCLAWPSRRPTAVAPLDLAALGTLTFEAPDRRRFPAVALAEAALVRGGGATCTLNAANEVAVEAFLAGRIGFLAIAETVASAIGRADAEGLLSEPGSLDDILALDRRARAIARGILDGGIREGKTAT